MLDVAGFRAAHQQADLLVSRFGARYRYKTLTVEVGWPRLPEHGFLTDNGLARAQVSLSQNTMLQPQIVAELVFKKSGSSEPKWYVLHNKATGPETSVARLNEYLNLILTD